MRMRTFWLNLGWLVVLVVTFAVPLALDAAARLTYFTSLTMWLIPILYLWPTFTMLTANGTGRRRRALRWTVVTIVGLGVVLDFVLGFLILRFPGCTDPAVAPTGRYLLCLPAVRGRIPIEELLFYAMGPVAMVLVYACADERWLSRYNPPDDLIHLKLIQVSPRLAATGAVAAVAAVILWRVNGTFPAYFAFLAAGAVLPAMFLCRSIGALTNWPAFAITTFYLLLTSVIWEVTLAIPRLWWGYEPSGMVGVTIVAWSRGEAIFPIEAAVVWIFAPFASVLTYEFAKALTHHPKPTRVALFGASPTARRPDERGQAARSEFVRAILCAVMRRSADKETLPRRPSGRKLRATLGEPSGHLETG
jgi:hypothetical protein